MTSIKLILTGAHAWASVEGPLTSGMVGIPVTIEYDEPWNGLTKNLMCRCSPWNSNDGEVRTILNVGETSTVAHEVMQAGMYLHLGVEGFSSDGTLVIPTTWARCGKIEYGANTCDDPSTEPELPIWNQLQTEVEQIKRDGYTQEQIDEIQAYVQAASQSASSAARAKESAMASSNLASSYVNTARNSADSAQTYAENANASASSAANLANGALQAQRAAEAAAERAEAAADSEGYGTLATAQINALDGMFKVAAYDGDSAYAAAYAAFKTAFAITDSGDDGDDSGGDSGGEETGVSNESTWTNGVAYSFEPILNEYPDKSNGNITTYENWTRTPYLYCAGASTLRVTATANTSSLQGGANDNAFYDADKNYVSGFSYTGLGSVEPGTYVDVDIPENAAYFILSGGYGRFPGQGQLTPNGCITITPYE